MNQILTGPKTMTMPKMWEGLFKNDCSQKMLPTNVKQVLLSQAELN